MKKIFSISLVFLVLLISNFIFIGKVYTADAAGTTPSAPEAGDGIKPAEPVKLDNPLEGTGVKDLNTFIGQVIKGVLGIVGSLALVMFVYGGFTWMMAGGNSAGIEKGKQIIIWSVFGLIVIFSSYVLVKFIMADVLGLTMQ